MAFNLTTTLTANEAAANKTVQAMNNERQIYNNRGAEHCNTIRGAYSSTLFNTKFGNNITLQTQVSQKTKIG